MLSNSGKIIKNWPILTEIMKFEDLWYSETLLIHYWTLPETLQSDTLLNTTEHYWTLPTHYQIPYK